MYREELMVLDCTIRDGGLINNHQFSLDFVRETYKNLVASGVDYIELGYKNSKKLFSDKEYGPWKFCSDEDINKVIEGVESSSKIAVMVDIGRVDMEDIKPANESPVDMIRVATYVKDIDKAIVMSNEFAELGYETTINIMAISRDKGPELADGLVQIEKESKCIIVNIVDSFGNLYQEDVTYLANLFKEKVPSKIIGIHAHNNMSMGLGNSIQAIMEGANSIDATISGIGRGAGNAQLELLLGFLKNPKFDIRPIFKVMTKLFVPLREEIEWGYIIPYAITGILNEHPRDAIAYRKTEEKDDYLKFYDKMIKPE